MPYIYIFGGWVGGELNQSTMHCYFGNWDEHPCMHNAIVFLLANTSDSSARLNMLRLLLFRQILPLLPPLGKVHQTTCECKQHLQIHLMANAKSIFRFTLWWIIPPLSTSQDANDSWYYRIPPTRNASNDSSVYHGHDMAWTHCHAGLWHDMTQPWHAMTRQIPENMFPLTEDMSKKLGPNCSSVPTCRKKYACPIECILFFCINIYSGVQGDIFAEKTLTQHDTDYSWHGMTRKKI